MKTIMFKDIPMDVYQLFKTACAAKGRTMKEVFIQLMINFIQDGRDPWPTLLGKPLVFVSPKEIKVPNIVGR